MNTESKIALELQKIGENKLTNEIIIPLLESMGYDKVEFNGGPKEEGKDIILWDKDRFDNRKLSVAQIKHFKATNTAADQKSFQGIINQLENCFSRTLINTVDLKPYSPSEVMFITSYAVDTATLHTRFSLERALKDHKVLIIDGLRLSELLIKHKPEIVQSLIGIDHDIASKTTLGLNNRILLDALGHQEDLELQNIYTHIDFSLGKHSTRLFFSDGLTSINKVVKLGHEDWVRFKKYCELISSEYSINFMGSTIDSLDKKNKDSLFKHAKWKSTNEGLSHSFQEASSNSNSLLKKYKKMKLDHDKMFTEIKTNGEQPDQNQQFKSLDRSLKNLKYQLDKVEKERALFGGLFENSLKSEPKLVIEFHVYGDKLIKQITEKRIWIEKHIKLLNAGNHETFGLQTFITRAKEIIDATEIILSNPLLFQGLVREDGKIRRNSYESTRLKLNIQDIFDTGHNFMVLGEAGAGKTTSLQMYARNMMGKGDSQVLWIPLARLIQTGSKLTK